MGQGWAARHEFWEIPPGEIWWLVDAHIPPEKREDPDRDARLLRLLENAIAEADADGEGSTK